MVSYEGSRYHTSTMNLDEPRPVTTLASRCPMTQFSDSAASSTTAGVPPRLAAAWRASMAKRNFG